jgi:hypothetical protein
MGQAQEGSQRGGREQSAPSARSETRVSFEPCGEPISADRVRQLPGGSGNGTWRVGHENVFWVSSLTAAIER